MNRIEANIPETDRPPAPAARDAVPSPESPDAGRDGDARIREADDASGAIEAAEGAPGIPSHEIAVAEDEAAAPADPERPLVIIVHASVGSGHRSAANAIAQALRIFCSSAAFLIWIMDD